MQYPSTARERLAAIRKRLRISQEKLGAHFNRGQSWVSKLENGDIPLEYEILEETARFLGVPLRDLIPPNGKPSEMPGFSDCIVESWAPKAEDEQGARAFDPAALAPGARRPATFRLPHDRAAPFGFPRGTVIVVDLALMTDHGHLGVANVVDPETGTAKTVLGRRLDDYLVGPNFANDPTDQTYIDPDQVGAIYPVVAWFSEPDVIR